MNAVCNPSEKPLNIVLSCFRGLNYYSASILIRKSTISSVCKVAHPEGDPWGSGTGSWRRWAASRNGPGLGWRPSLLPMQPLTTATLSLLPPWTTHIQTNKEASVNRSSNPNFLGEFCIWMYVWEPYYTECKCMSCIIYLNLNHICSIILEIL